MSAFGYGLAAAFVAATLLASGLGHLARPGQFAALLRSHGTVPAMWSPAVAGAVTAGELLGGSLAAALLLGYGRPWAAGVFGCGAVAGAVLLGYVGLLLRRPAPPASCGCTPLAAPLTPLAQLPAAGLLLASLCGLGCAVAPAVAPLDWLAAVLPVVWGMLLAVLAMLAPATAPEVRGGAQ